MQDMGPDLAFLEPGRRSLALWTGRGDDVDLDALAAGPVAAIAEPLTHARRDGGFLASAAGRGLDVVLPGEAWRNQLPLGHPKRSFAFDSLAFAQEEALQPGATQFSRGFCDDYAGAYVDEQLRCGATIASTPGHLAPGEDAMGPTRENDLRLARAAVREFVERGAHEAVDGRRRAIVATVPIDVAQLATDLRPLVEAYAELAVDGYWVVVAGAKQPTGAVLEAVTGLALTLQSKTGHNACVSCVGAPHLALLAAGVSATCYTPFGDGGTGVYHREILGRVRVGTRLFESYPCDCGAHPPDWSPRGPAAVREHNLRCLLADAREFASCPALDATALLRARVERAREARTQLGMTRLNSAAWAGPGRALADRAAQRRAA